jgi:hypothetical protein
LVFALSLLTQTAFPQLPLPRIDRLDPGHASPNEVITINVYGANFNQRMRLQIDGCVVQKVKFDTVGRLRAQVFIPPNIGAGYKNVILVEPTPSNNRVFTGKFEIIQKSSSAPVAVPSGPSSPDHKGKQHVKVNPRLPKWLYPFGGGCVAIAVALLTVGHGLRLKRRKKWQKNAKDKKPQLPCRESESYCQKERVKSEAKLTLRLYRVDKILIIPHEPESGREGSKVLVEEEIVDQLNQAIAARRLGEAVDDKSERVARIAHMILQTIDETLNTKTSSKDVTIVARLTGGEVEFEFTLYRCKKKGAVNVWEEEDSWKASIEDKRDEPFATLRGLSTTDFGSSDHRFIELTKQLIEFIREP